MPDIVVVGTGPHSEMCAAVLRSSGLWNVVGHVAADDEDPPAGIPLAGHDRNLPSLREQVAAAFIGIGDNPTRQRVTARVAALGFALPSVVAPSAVVADDVAIGAGVLVSPGAVINTQTTVGDGVIVNTAAVVEHHVQIGQFAHIAPNSTLCGSVEVGARALVGAAAVVLPGIHIGADAIVAAGSAIARGVAAGAIAGLPTNTRTL